MTSRSVSPAGPHLVFQPIHQGIGGVPSIRGPSPSIFASIPGLQPTSMSHNSSPQFLRQTPISVRKVSPPPIPPRHTATSHHFHHAPGNMSQHTPAFQFIPTHQHPMAPPTMRNAPSLPIRVQYLDAPHHHLLNGAGSPPLIVRPISNQNGGATN